MKICWIVNFFCGALAKKHGQTLTSGQWINAELEKEKALNKNEIIVCTSSTISEELVDGNIKYVVLSHGSVSSYSDTLDKRQDWISLFANEKPDIILVWGTEYSIGKCVLAANNKKIPALIYIQGVVSSIYKNYRGGLSDKQIAKMTTLLEKLRKTGVFNKEIEYEKKVQIERETVALAHGVIVENNWASQEYYQMNPQIQIYKSRLPINQVFSNHSWNEKDYQRRMILTTASAYPLKGFHNALKVIIQLKKKYKDVCLVVPGNNNFFVKGFLPKLKQSGYCRNIRKFILKHKIKDNILFVGALSAEEYASYMEKAEIFLSSSAIENHGSAIREAMTVGIPCVVSAVGGIPEYAEHKQNCSLYKYGDIEQTVEQIEELFENDKLKQKYSLNGKAKIDEMYKKDTLQSLQEIYALAVDK